MSYPNQDGINQAVAALQTDPAQVYAFAAEHARVPFNTGDLNTFMDQVNGWWNTAYLGAHWDAALTISDLLSYVEANGGLPSTVRSFGDWAEAHGLVKANGTRYDRASYPTPGQFYPPNGGKMDPPGTTYNVTPISSGQGTVGMAPSGNGQTTTGSAPSPVGQGFSGAFSNLGQWVSQHPLEIAAGAAAYLIATGKIRLDRLL